LEESPASSEYEYQQLQENQRRMVYNGRDPKLELYHYGKERSAQQWGQDIFSKLQPIAEILDTHSNSQNYQQSVSNELNKLNNQSLTPSAKVLEGMQKQDVTFYRWAMNASLANRNHFLQLPPNPTEVAYYEIMARESLKKQLAFETDTSICFEQYLADYYAQYNSCSKGLNIIQALA
jgi:glutamate--cysteine ligase